MTDRVLDELGFYLLSGEAADPADLPEEARLAERLGLGRALLTERWRMQIEVASLSGAALAATSTIEVGTAATNHHLRHPVISASWAATMERMSGGRFTLGIGPGVAAVYRSFGLPSVTTDQMRDWATLIRRLWTGEVIRDHTGPAGDFPVLRIDAAPLGGAVPLCLVAFDDDDLELGGEMFDEIVLHTFLSSAMTVRAVETVRRAAERVGRDPSSIRIWACVVTAGDHLPEEVRLRRTVGRLANYLQYLGEGFIADYGWPPEVLSRFRSDPLVTSFTEPIDGKAPADQLGHIAGMLPGDWHDSVATGSVRRCVEIVRSQFACGVDGVILHSATPSELEPVLVEYRKRRV